MSARGRAPFSTVARGVLRWCAWYTRGLDADVAADRQEELASDLHEQRAWAIQSGQSEAALHRSLVVRAIAGIPADLTWRRQQIRSGAVDLEAPPAPGLADVITATAFILGLAQVAASVYTIMRFVQAVDAGRLDAAPIPLAIIGLLAALAAVGCALLVLRLSRAVGAALLILPSLLLPTLCGDALVQVSATTAAMAPYTPGWSIVLVSAGLLVCTLAALVLSWPERSRRAVPA